MTAILPSVGSVDGVALLPSVGSCACSSPYCRWCGGGQIVPYVGLPDIGPDGDDDDLDFAEVRMPPRVVYRSTTWLRKVGQVAPRGTWSDDAAIGGGS